MFHHLRELMVRAHRAGIDVMPLKGAHLLSSVYHIDEDRGLMADLDFLVRQRDWQSMLSMMKEYGFAARTHYADESNTHEQGFTLEAGAGSGILFEVHRHLFDPARLPIHTDSIWERASTSVFEGVPCFRMSDEDAFCHIALHSAIHRFMQHDRTLEDLFRIVTRETISNQAGSPAPGFSCMPRTSAGIVDLYERVSLRAHRWNCTRSVWIYLWLLQKKSASQLQPNDQQAALALMDALSPPAEVQKILKALIGTGTQTRFARLPHRVQAAVIWPLVFDDLRSLQRMVSHHPKISRLLRLRR